jgi:hypothetical protein
MHAKAAAEAASRQLHRALFMASLFGSPKLRSRPRTRAMRFPSGAPAGGSGIGRIGRRGSERGGDRRSNVRVDHRHQRRLSCTSSLSSVAVGWLGPHTFATSVGAVNSAVSVGNNTATTQTAAVAAGGAFIVAYAARSSRHIACQNTRISCRAMWTKSPQLWLLTLWLTK